MYSSPQYSLFLFPVAPTLEHRIFVKSSVSLQFLNPETFGRTSRRKDSTYTRQHKPQNKRIQTSMPWVGIEPTIPVIERAETVHSLDCAATVIGPTSVLDGRNWSASRHSLGKILPYILEGWEYLWTCVDVVALRNILAPVGNRIAIVACLFTVISRIIWRQIDCV
jgi:hypothetical protein